MGKINLWPKESLHTEVSLEQITLIPPRLDRNTRVVMETRGRYHEPIAASLHEYGICITVMNPLFIKQNGVVLSTMW